MIRRIGVDLGMKSNHKIVVVDESGNTGRPTSIEFSLDGFQTLLDKALNGQDRCTTQVLMEPTGNVWLPLAAFLRAHGVPIVMNNTQKVSAFRKVLRQYVKTDIVDAEANARLPQLDPKRTHKFEMPPVEVLSLRHLVKERDRFVRDITACKQRIHGALQLVNPRLTDCFGEEKFTQTARVMLRDYADPFTVVKLGEKTFSKQLRKKSRRVSEEQVHDIFVACDEVCRLYKVLVESKALPFDYRVQCRTIHRELAAIEFAEAQVKELDASIKELYERIDPAQTLHQIPGMGSTITAAIEALSSPVDRFRNAKAYASYCGLVPRMSQTGVGPHDRSCHITKSGQRLLKKYLHLAAETARQVDPELAAYYAAKSAAGCHHGRIMAALAHKLARRVYALLRRRENDALRQDNNHQLQTYQLRTPQGEVLSREAARAYVKEHYPSKRETARRITRRVNKKRDASQLENEGQPEGSANRVRRDHVPALTLPKTESLFHLKSVSPMPVENSVENG